MKFILPILLLFAILVCNSQTTDSSRTNVKPKEQSNIISRTELDPPLYWLISSVQRIVIQRPKYFKISIDEYGNFVNANSDTLAKSCEILEAINFMLDSCFVAKTSVTDSADEYKAQVLFYRQWFKTNDTPNPLKPKQDFKNN